ncbi:MAG: DUF3422 domain-containing protein [Pseudomonadota bacterium]
MATKPIEDYPERYALSNELHARPFPELAAPCRAAYVAIKREKDAAYRDRGEDLAHLVELLDRHGAPHPAPGTNHHTVRLGRGMLKWEQHTEFVTYTVFADGVADTPFDGSAHALLSADWLSRAPGKLLSSCLVRIETATSREAAADRVQQAFHTWFVPESLATSSVLDGAAVIGSDFRIDENGHVRFAVLAANGTGRRRLGRIVQRLLEIETYKSMAMLALPHARRVSGKVATLDKELAETVQHMADGPEGDEETLDRLLRISAEVELLSASTAFRFGAAGAYEAIVNQRIEVLREERLGGRQTFGEFMMRRFDPAMRTYRSAQARMKELSQRAERASNLLRTRVDVASAMQNAEVLRRMDDRAALQLRLQQTVEGLSVVAISYYAVNLAANVTAPLAADAGIGSGWVYAGLTPAVVLLVWLFVRRVRHGLNRR